MLIGPHFRVVITDFGLVESMDTSTANRDLAGTPLYLAPELIQKELIPEDQLHLSDIYALGISTYEMLTGEMPFDGTNIKEILHGHLHDTPPLISTIRSDIPAAFDAVLARAMDKDPVKRYGSSIEFLGALIQAREVESNAPRTGTKRILIVDDDPDVRTLYATALKIGVANSIVMTAEDGISALEMVKTWRPDLILLDIEMPKMNGLEVCASLTGDDLTAEIPLLILSAHSETNTRSLLKSMGVRQILNKPLELTHLVDIARRHLGEA